MTTSPPKRHRPSEAGSSERREFALGGLLVPLIEAGYEEDAREVVGIYVEDHTARIAEISTALESGNLESCANAAHSLAGSAGGIGAKDLSDALTALEKACRAKDPGGVEAAWAEVQEEKERVLFTARRFLSEGSAES